MTASGWALAGVATAGALALVVGTGHFARPGPQDAEPARLTAAVPAAGPRPVSGETLGGFTQALALAPPATAGSSSLREEPPMRDDLLGPEDVPAPVAAPGDPVLAAP